MCPTGYDLRQQDRTLNLAPCTLSGSSLKSGSLSPKACDGGPLASQRSLKDADQIGITVPLVPHTELGQTSNAENEG